MNPELKKIETHLIKSLKFSQETFKDLSKPKTTNAKIPTSLVDDITNKAFCFDDISDSFYGEHLHLCSADALLLKDNLYLIEFKPLGPKNLNYDISQKMIESFHTLRERIFTDSKADPNKFEMHFILVKDDNAIAKYVKVAKQHHGKPISTTPVVDTDNESFGKYRQQYIDCPKRVYYNSVEIWTKREFEEKITKLK
jgi:hypothetical protein